MKKFIIVFLVLFIEYLNAGVKDPAKVIIPKPLKIIEQKGIFNLTPSTTIISGSNTFEEAKYLAEILKKLFGEPPVIKKNGITGIILRINKLLGYTSGKEGYVFTVSENNILIEASTPTGIFYGIQTLRQLLPLQLENKDNKIVKLKQVKIIDKPRFPWRAFMLDEARYFKGTKSVKMLLDQMALHKMNIFHWHLVDDQGWRIEIKKYPKLTEIGSKREDSMIDGWDSNIYSGKPHEGYYTQKEIKDIIRYAKKRHITIIPEIEMPGHSASAIAAYPWLGTSGILKGKVPSSFGYDYDIYDITKPEVVGFLENVLKEIINLFPSKIIHIGADEVLYDIWKNSKSVSAYMKKNKLTPADLQILFTNKISQFLAKHNRRMMGWNEILAGAKIHDNQNINDVKTSQNLAPNTIIHFWKGDLNLIKDAVEKGYDVVNSFHKTTYLDYTYTRLPIEKAYKFNPIPEGLKKKYNSKILGVGCQMWGEWIPDEKSMEFRVFPRLSAIAEVAWTKNSLKDYDDFMRRLKYLEKRWKLQGIKYGLYKKEFLKF